MKDHYSLVLNDMALATLHKVIGKKISRIVTSGVSIKDDRIFSHYFALQISESEWLNVSSDWGDTPKTYIDYWYFDISISTYPTRVAKKTNNNKVLWRSAAEIELSLPIDHVVEVTLHSYGDRNNIESVHCDRSLTFTGRNGNSFSLVTPPTIIGWMELVTKRSVQDERLMPFQKYKKIPED